MPGAQAEEPPADEERSEPVQVGGGAFLGRDDLEEVSDEEVDWSNDEENLMIVEESIDEEESNCEFTNEREVVEISWEIAAIRQFALKNLPKNKYCVFCRW